MTNQDIYRDIVRALMTSPDQATCTPPEPVSGHRRVPHDTEYTRGYGDGYEDATEETVKEAVDELVRGLDEAIRTAVAEYLRKRRGAE